MKNHLEIPYETPKGAGIDRFALIALIMAILGIPLSIVIIFVEAVLLNLTPPRDLRLAICILFILMPQIIAGISGIRALVRIAKGKGQVKGLKCALFGVTFSIVSPVVAVLIAFWCIDSLARDMGL